MPTMVEMKVNLDKRDIKYPSTLNKEELNDLYEETFFKDTTPEPEPQIEVYDDKQDHITIDCRVTTLDGKSSSRMVKIINPEGCIFRSQVNNPEGVFQTVFAGLVKKYGAGHIK